MAIPYVFSVANAESSVGEVHCLIKNISVAQGQRVRLFEFGHSYSSGTGATELDGECKGMRIRRTLGSGIGGAQVLEEALVIEQSATALSMFLAHSHTGNQPSYSSDSLLDYSIKPRASFKAVFFPGREIVIPGADGNAGLGAQLTANSHDGPTILLTAVYWMVLV